MKVSKNYVKNMYYGMSNRSLILLALFFVYELIAISANLFSPTLFILSTLNLTPTKSQVELKEYYRIINQIIQNNPLNNPEIFKSMEKHFDNIEIVGVTSIISYHPEYFYVQNVNNIKAKDIVLNQQNLLGIVEKVGYKISRVRYIKSNSFQIPAKVIYTNPDNPILGFIKTSSRVYFYPLDPKSSVPTNGTVKTAGYFSIPSGIPIGIIYSNNEVKMFRSLTQTDQVIIIRKKQT
ncbi:MAG: rod shape-determining protein MreC [bacterium]